MTNRFKEFTMANLKKRITTPTGSGGFRTDIKLQALKELIRRQAKKK